MKIKRVGTISMSIVLIVFGIILFVSQISKNSALDLIFKIWPLILIMIGLEILGYRYLSKDENIIIKYDFFSILIVFSILIFNIGLFAISESGLIYKLQNTFISTNYKIDVMNEYVVDDDINKIIIEDINNLVIRSTEDNKISGIGKLNIYAKNEKEANELSSLNNIRYNKSGDVLYIYTINNSHNNYSYSNIIGFDIFIPQNVDVEVMDCYNMDLVFNGFDNKWIFDGVNNINIRLDGDSNVMVKAFVESLEFLNGNVEWLFNDYGEYINGDGMKEINILNSSNIVVNEI